MRPILTGLCCATLLLAGCGTARTPDLFSGGAPQVAAPPDKVSAMLADAADRAANALEELAAVEAARGPSDPLATAPIAGAPEGLQRAVTVQWVGPVEPIAQALAARAGYTFKATGAAPPEGVIVRVDAENQPVIEVLRSIGLQMGERADLRLDGVAEVVEISYVPHART